jgi:hypothetical protein
LACRIAACIFLLFVIALVETKLGSLHAAIPTPQDYTGKSYTISYADAAYWLENLPAEEREEQIRDYTLLGLAALLGLDIEQLRDAFYDHTPVRDSLFWDLSANQSGLGRSFFDGQNTLHVLLPSDDPYAARTIGMILDDHRKNVGSDAGQIALFRYSIDAGMQQVVIQQEQVQPTATVRQLNGYIEMPIGTLPELEQFLAQTQHLSQLEVIDGEIHAAGWNWPGIPTGRVTVEDVAVLQRGYVNARGETITVSDFLANIVPADYGLEIVIPAEVKAAAEKVDALLTALERADSEGEFNKILTDYEEVILDVVLDDDVARQLAVKRSTYGKIEWLNALWEALIDAIEGKDLWGFLLYVASGEFYLPEPGVTEPGFSLDPGSPMPLSEVLTVLPTDHYPQLVGRDAEVITFLEGWFADSDAETFWEFLSQHEDFILEVVFTESEATKAQLLLDIMDAPVSDKRLIEAAGTYLDLIYAALQDPERPWPVLVSALLDNKPPYQFARYDGGLQGTEAGMTYFYTDILAKGYFYELGGGSPYGIVDGFLPESRTTVPWGHCTTGDQEGRIWFGLREEAVGIFPELVALGGVTTRVFVLMEDQSGSGEEVEPSYMFGQGIWWWDRHYLAMADYEPQYHRLDQLMRWGVAIAWLVDGGEVLLPTPPASQITEDWHFAEWLAAHPELTWKYDVPFVDVPEQNTETVLRLFSEPYELCGSSWISSGGISNPSMGRIAEIAEQRPDLPAAVSRGGLDAVSTDYSQSRNSGTIASLNGVRRTLPAIEGNSATIDVVADGRKVWSLGGLKVALPETTPRRLEVSMAKDEGVVEWQIGVQDVELGSLSIDGNENYVELAWDQGPLAELQSLLNELQELLVDLPIDVALEELSDVLVVETDDDSGTYHLQITSAEVDSPISLTIGLEPSASDGELAFRLAKPTVEDGIAVDITWYYVSLVEDSLSSNN